MKLATEKRTVRINVSEDDFFHGAGGTPGLTRQGGKHTLQRPKTPASPGVVCGQGNGGRNGNPAAGMASIPPAGMDAHSCPQERKNAATPLTADSTMACRGAAGAMDGLESDFNFASG